MQPEWIGTISALAGAAVAGGLAFARDIFGVKRQDQRDAAQRLHEISERRFDARLGAYVSFGAACHRALNATDTHSDEQGDVPGAFGIEGPITYLIDPLDLVRIIGPPEAATAAAWASDRIHAYAFDPGPRAPTRGDAANAIDQFALVARQLLKLDVIEPPSSST